MLVGFLFIIIVILMEKATIIEVKPIRMLWKTAAIAIVAYSSNEMCKTIAVITRKGARRANFHIFVLYKFKN